MDIVWFIHKIRPYKWCKSNKRKIKWASWCTKCEDVPSCVGHVWLCIRCVCVCVRVFLNQTEWENETLYFICVKRYGVLVLVELITVFPVAHMFSRPPNTNSTHKKITCSAAKVQEEAPVATTNRAKKKCNYNSKCEQNLSSKRANVRERERDPAKY